MQVLTAQQFAQRLMTSSYSDGVTRTMRPGSDGAISVNVTGLDAQEQWLARAALREIGDMTGLQFREVAGSAQITYSHDGSGANTRTTASGRTIDRATVSISADRVAPDDGYGSFAFRTYVHETLHALGLGHPQDYGRVDEFSESAIANDSWQISIMSYFDQDENSWVNATKAYHLTPMLADYLALRQMYDPAAMHLGPTTYGVNSNAGGSLDAIARLGARATFLIADHGGIDRVNFSTATAAQRINLASGSVSDVMGAVGNMVIAPDTVIENATGGQGADTIAGNGTANRLAGAGGNDILYGRFGNDVLEGANGSDRLWGEDGSDQLFGGAGNDSLYGGAGDDRLADAVGANLLDGAAGDDVLNGGSGADQLLGGAGNDTLNGGAGNDRLADAVGTNLLNGGAGHDVLNGGSGADQMMGGEDNDTLYGGAGNDRLMDGSGTNQLFGGNGDDMLIGGTGNDFLVGGAGADTLWGGEGNDWIQADEGNDQVSGHGGDDRIHGRAGDDIIMGNAGNDTILGEAGNDDLIGDNGNDVLDGGIGNDLLRGGAGADRFVFNSGIDTIRGFDQSQDVVGLASFAGLDSWGDVRSHLFQAGGNVEFRLNGNVLRIEGKSLADLGADDFLW